MAKEINIDDIKATLEGTNLSLEMPQETYEYLQQRAEAQGLDFEGLIHKILKDQVDAAVLEEAKFNRVARGLLILGILYVSMFFFLGCSGSVDGLFSVNTAKCYRAEVAKTDYGVLYCNKYSHYSGGNYSLESCTDGNDYLNIRNLKISANKVECQ